MTADRRFSRCHAVAVALVLAVAAGLLALALKPDLGAAPRHFLKRVDHAVLDGFVHRMLLDDPATDVAALAVPPPRAGAYGWADDGAFLAIAHGLGPSLRTGANSLATFERGRELGFTIFEVDLVLTADGVLACHHGRAREDLDALTWAEIRRRAPDACRFDALVAAAAEHPDLRFVLDVKNRFDDAYDAVEDLVRARGVAGSFIPQIYHFSQLRRFRENPGFGGVVFTAYRSALPLDRVLDYATRAGVTVVAVPAEHLDQWRGSLPDAPRVLTHPVNDPFHAWRLRARGVDGIYTSFLTPGTAPDLFGPAGAPPPPGPPR